MNLENRLRSTLARRAERVQESDDAWSRISGRTREPRPVPPRPFLALGSLAAVEALGVAAVVLGREPGTTVVVTDPSTTLAPPTTMTAPTSEPTTLSDAGLYTEEELDLMRRGGGGYLGYRVSITADGDWILPVAGD